MKYPGTLVAAASLCIATTAYSAPVDVDLMFVIDQSGSMGNELSTLAANIDIVFNGLAASADVSSVAGGLVVYEAARNGVGVNDLELFQPLTQDAMTLGAAIASVPLSGGTEDALSAVDSVLPGGVLFGASGWRNDTVKSIILITDENADDAGIYSNAFGTGYAALGAKLSDAGYLNNIITTTGLFSTYEPASRPIGDPGDFVALFDINNFTGPGADPQAFLAGFTATKLTELTTGGTPTTGGSDPTNVIPLPAAGWMMIAGLGGLGALRRRRKMAQAA